MAHHRLRHPLCLRAPGPRAGCRHDRQVRRYQGLLRAPGRELRRLRAGARFCGLDDRARDQRRGRRRHRAGGVRADRRPHRLRAAPGVDFPPRGRRHHRADGGRGPGRGAGALHRLAQRLRRFDDVVRGDRGDRVPAPSWPRRDTTPFLAHRRVEGLRLPVDRPARADRLRHGAVRGPVPVRRVSLRGGHADGARRRRLAEGRAVHRGVRARRPGVRPHRPSMPSTGSGRGA